MCRRRAVAEARNPMGIQWERTPGLGRNIHIRAQASSLLGKVFVFLAAAVLLVAAFLFSLVVLAIVVLGGLLLAGYFWWQTHQLRRRSRDPLHGARVIEPIDVRDCTRDRLPDS